MAQGIAKACLAAKIRILHHVRYNDSFVEIDINDLMEEEDMIALKKSSPEAVV